MKTDFLQDPLKGIVVGDTPTIQERSDKIAKKIKDRFDKIAEKLFCNYGIKCGDKMFRFAELEFYYYKNEEASNAIWNDTWNRETYPRNKNAGELFFHYSGVDICFQCHFEEKKRKDEFGEFGGILVRSLLDGEKLLAGPSFCANVMLNTCKGKMPYLEQAEKQSFEYQTCFRCGIDSDKKQKNGQELYLCYYLTSVNDHPLAWDKASEQLSWDKKNGIFYTRRRNYKKERRF